MAGQPLGHDAYVVTGSPEVDMLSLKPQAATRSGWRRMAPVGVASQCCLSRRVGIRRTGRPRSDDCRRCADPGCASADRMVNRSIVCELDGHAVLMSIPRTVCWPCAVWLGEQVNGGLFNAP